MRVVATRLASSVVILLGVTFLTFVLAFVVPADPAVYDRRPEGGPGDAGARPPRDGPRRAARPAVRALPQRLAHGDLGRSYLTRQHVRDAILERLPATALPRRQRARPLGA